MRIWTLHPKYLDSRGLVAAWREALLAQKVLKGETRGYLNHPQLERFRACPDPQGAIASYLTEVAVEAAARGYRFDSLKIGSPSDGRIRSTTGQLAYEWTHFRSKSRQRSETWYQSIEAIEVPDPHPIFEIFPGGIEGWERR